MKANITPAYVLGLTEACEEFLCPIEANVHDICFGKTILRNMANNQLVFEDIPPGGFRPLPKEDKDRKFEFHLPSDFLRINSAGMTFEFKIGPVELKNLRVIERHFFFKKLIKSYDMEFGYCMPDSVNTWETMITLPQLSEEEIAEIVKNPGKYKTDTYFFNENNLFSHIRSDITYLQL